MAAMALALRSKGKQTEQLLLSHLPSKYEFVFDDAGLTHRDAERGLGGGIPDWHSEEGHFDTWVVVDTGTFSQLPGMEAAIPAFEQRGGTVLILDHHKTQEPWGTERLVDVTASSAAELVWRTIKQWGVAPTRQIAAAVYVGVVTDTGWFQFSNTQPSTMRLAAELMEIGVDTDAIYQRLYQCEREARVRLQTRAMNSLEILAGGKLAVMRVSKEDFAAAGAQVPATENLINVPLQIATVEMSILAVETPEGGPIRVSCRSKGKVDVAKFAEQFGGGGHARASGLKVAGTLGEAVDKVTAAAVSAIG